MRWNKPHESEDDIAPLGWTQKKTEKWQTIYYENIYNHRVQWRYPVPVVLPKIIKLGVLGKTLLMKDAPSVAEDHSVVDPAGLDHAGLDHIKGNPNGAGGLFNIVRLIL